LKRGKGRGWNWERHAGSSGKRSWDGTCSVQGHSTDDVEDLVVRISDACECFLAETEGACVGTSVAFTSDVDADGGVDLVLGAADNSEGDSFADAAWLILFADME
jgi:hypothetical protein